jgi:hypothetical protein
LLTAYNNLKHKPKIFSYVFGLGGREITQKDIEDLLVSVINNKPKKERYVGIKE